MTFPRFRLTPSQMPSADERALHALTGYRLSELVTALETGRVRVSPTDDVVTAISRVANTSGATLSEVVDVFLALSKPV